MVSNGFLLQHGNKIKSFWFAAVLQQQNIFFCSNSSAWLPRGPYSFSATKQNMMIIFRKVCTYLQKINNHDNWKHIDGKIKLLKVPWKTVVMVFFLPSVEANLNFFVFGCLCLDLFRFGQVKEQPKEWLIVIPSL